MSNETTDRELLEAAAKAAGIELVPYTWDKGSPWGEHAGFTVQGKGPDEWNPLEDDAGALRLAVRLREKFGTDIAACFGIGRFLEWETDPYAATRRAIVRAAAEIGRTP